jgi:beta-phosphoglucomutase-like phosphatase (HAD superfamily)
VSAGSRDVRAVIFDLDGVLIDSEPLWEQVRRELVSEHGGHWTDEAQRRLMGMSTQEWSRYLSEDLGVGLPPQEVASVVIGRMATSYASHLPLMPGAAEAVRRMAGHWPLGLASSSPAALVEAVLDSAELQPFFRVTMSTEQVEHGKPSPDVYMAVAAELDVSTDQCVAVEDSSNGLRSASAAGMRTVAIPRPCYPPAADALALAEVVLPDLGGLTPELLTTLSQPRDVLE